MITNLETQITSTLPEGFTVRGATEADLEAAMLLFNRWSQSVIQQNEVSIAEPLLNEWRSPGFDPAQDIRLVFAPDGRMAGYIEVWKTAKPPVHPWMWGRVDPDFEGLGIGTWLLGWAEQHACLALEQLPPELRFAPRVGTYRAAHRSSQLFKDLGYTYNRSSYVMRIEMETPPAAPIWPEGIHLRTFNPETDMEAVYQAEVDAFRDHFGFVEEPYDEGLARFKHLETGYEGFDPSLFFLAMEAGQIAGFSLCPPCSYEDYSLGWVGTLGVRRPWRKRGLGLALLQHSFAEFYRRGKRKVGLGVDADSLTGALRLYEKAGMHIHQAFDLYERELRPGMEIRVESLTT
jgi:GNAT superfamily N-acetyltransferase